MLLLSQQRRTATVGVPAIIKITRDTKIKPEVTAKTKMAARRTGEKKNNI